MLKNTSGETMWDPLENASNPHTHQDIRAEDQPYNRVEVTPEKREIIAAICQELPGHNNGPYHIIAHAQHAYGVTLSYDEVRTALES